MTQGERALSWNKNSNLSANPKKSQLLTINPRKVDIDKDNQDISVDGYVIERMGEIKLLGVQTVEKLNFTSHISELCTKASEKVGLLVWLRNLIPCKAKLALYKSLIWLHLTYCHLVWHFCNASDRRKLERIQERSTESGVQNQISILSRTARSHQITYVVKKAITKHCHFDV